MKKWFALFIAIALLSVSFCAAADGVTLKTVSSFAGTDAAAGAYVAYGSLWRCSFSNCAVGPVGATQPAGKFPHQGTVL